MKPNPFCPLNHFTLPVGMTFPFPGAGLRAARASLVDRSSGEEVASWRARSVGASSFGRKLDFSNMGPATLQSNLLPFKAPHKVKPEEARIRRARAVKDAAT